MSRFGHFLVTAELVTAEQLDDALGHQAVHGARLGTNLVELGALSVEQLAQALSDFHKVPLPQRKWIEKPQRAATQRATRSLVERIRFIPMRLEGKVLHAALLDPRHPSVLDDLRFATGCRIQPYVMPEIWMHDWLLELFKIPRGIRHVQARRTSKRPRQRSSDQPVHAPRNSAPPPKFESNALPGTSARTPTSWAPQASPAQPSAPLDFTTTAPAGDFALLDLPPASRPPPVTQRERGASRPPPANLAAAASMRPPPVPLISLPPLPPKPGAPRSIPPARAPSPPQAAVAPAPAPARKGAGLPPLDQTSWSIASTPSALSAPKAATAPSIEAPVVEPEPVRDAQVFAEESPAAAAVAAAPQAQPAAPLAALAPAPVAVAQALDLARFEAQMLEANHRDRLIELALSTASCFAARVALFTVHQGMVQALRSEGGAVVPVDGMLLPLDTPCMLTEAATKNEPMRAQAQDRPLDMQILELIGDSDSDGVALFPVSIKNRVVNVLFASNGLEPVGEIAFAALSRLAQQMGVAYGRLIMSRKAAAGS
jgi:hypothetical protein